MKLFFKLEDGDREHFDLVQCDETEAEYTVDGFESFTAWNETFEAMDNEKQSIEHDMSVIPNVLKIVNGASWELLTTDLQKNFTNNNNWTFHENMDAMQEYYAR